MNRGCAALLAILLLFFLSLFPGANFKARLSIPVKVNPLWTENKQEIQSSLTEDLRKQGYVFWTGRGEEAGPEGICFGHFASDEYWVILYDSDRQVVDAYSWIIGLNWIGHLYATVRFSRLERTLREHIR